MGGKENINVCRILRRNVYKEYNKWCNQDASWLRETTQKMDVDVLGVIINE